MSVSLLFGCSINSYSTSSGEAKWLIKFYMLFVCWENYSSGTSAAAGKAFPGAAGETWAVQGRFWEPNGNQDTQSGHCLSHQRAQQEGPALNQSLGASSVYFPVGSTLWVSTHSLIMLNSLSQPQEEPQLRTGYIIKISTSEKLLFMRWIVRTTNRMVWVGRDLQDPRAQVLWPWLLQGISIWDWTLRVIYVLTWYLSNCLDFISPSSPNTSLATHPSC